MRGAEGHVRISWLGFGDWSWYQNILEFTFRANDETSTPSLFPPVTEVSIVVSDAIHQFYRLGKPEPLMAPLGRAFGFNVWPPVDDRVAHVDMFAYLDMAAATGGTIRLALADGTVRSGSLADLRLSEVPLPAGVVLLATGILGLGVLKRRNGRKSVS
jgi:hypothetical protein